MKDKLPKFCFTINLQGSRGNYPGSHEYYHIYTTFHPRYDEGFHPYNTGKNRDFRDLTLVSQGHIGHPNLYGVELEYKDIHTLTSKDLSSKLKALQWIEKQIEKIAESEGSWNKGGPLDGGYVEFLKRMTRILPLDEILIYQNSAALYQEELTKWPIHGKIEATIENWIVSKSRG